MYAFDLVKPGTVAEAASALAGGEAQALGGGQTLIPTLKQRLADPGTLVSLSHIDEMKYVRESGGTVEIGGGTTHAMVAKAVADIYPGLADLAGRIGDPSVRNRGTIGGSLANNDPSACYPAGALGSGATIITDKREIAADDYFQGMFTTALDEGEIVTGVRFPIPEKAHYSKMPQPASRFPLVAVYVAKFADGVRVAVTGASEDGVFRWTEAEEALGANFSTDALGGLSASEDGMIADIHGTAAYRAHLIGVMTKRAVAEMS
ncbi:FAD binding domain-containing protein [Pontivivens insulae]|uniref:Carbon monoxide dehydrogenase medium chain n=1 Tax=Pontivivens insulae TaxID=1639689 RepID=A0A2R8ADY4_9RHOB|nr:xanthine dehydrogenase family protein subunit M [Pontivivens insulae]RED14200.1 carbon-monoxide dehydrogenase medium subunit [Pontivivens insulae]SPF30275.1 Carbon monoxide dehydrogenase medium chain [Pontivivens insulae]